MIERNGVEQVVYAAESRREVELVLQRHIRSLTAGSGFIREAASGK
ncbi:MAG: hypothetical protein ABIK45_04910 [Pseudomonadota bacterium]